MAVISVAAVRYQEQINVYLLKHSRDAEAVAYKEAQRREQPGAVQTPTGYFKPGMVHHTQLRWRDRDRVGVDHWFVVVIDPAETWSP